MWVGSQDALCACVRACASVRAGVCWHALDAVVELSVISIYLFVQWHIKALSRPSLSFCCHLSGLVFQIAVAFVFNLSVIYNGGFKKTTIRKKVRASLISWRSTSSLGPVHKSEKSASPSESKKPLFFSRMSRRVIMDCLRHLIMTVLNGCVLLLGDFFCRHQICCRN